MSRPFLIASLLVVLALSVSGAAAPRDLLLYNPSPSIPSGFYARVNEAPRVGSIVTVRAVDVAPAYAALREFTDERDRFIKHVAAGGGAFVCADGDRILINGRTVAHRALQDASGHRLPRWNECRALQSGEVFLLGDTPDSFDSRYFGVVHLDQIEGVWRKL